MSVPYAREDFPKSSLPLYIHSMNWDEYFAETPAPDVWQDTIFKWSRDKIEAYQNYHFKLRVAEGWNNRFYRNLWTAQGLEPGDIRGVHDIGKLPIFNSDDIKKSVEDHPPFGELPGIDPFEYGQSTPLRILTSGGTTGTPRPSIFGPEDWERNGLFMARSLYVMGARPGDRLQCPATCSLLNYGWAVYQACHHYLGVVPLTTGSGVVTPTRKQVETAFQFSTNIWSTFPEYLTQVATTCRDELKRDPRELKTKFIQSWLGPDLDGSLRRHLEELWGCPVYDGYGTHEAGAVGFEGPDKDGIYLQEDVGVFEFVDVDTLQPVADGESGDIVYTHLHRKIPLLIRYNLRDLGRLKPQGTSALGSNMRRMANFLGRSDTMIKLRGTNVWPMGCLGAVRSDDRTTGEWVCIVRRLNRGGVLRDEMIVKVECKSDGRPRDGLKEILEKRLANDLGVKVEVQLVNEGGIPEANLGSEGKVRRLVDNRADVVML